MFLFSLYLRRPHKYLVTLGENWNLFTNFIKTSNAESHENPFLLSGKLACRQKEVGEVIGSFFNLMLRTR